MKVHAFRLKPGQDLKSEIVNYVREHQIKAGVIMMCVGSLNRAVIRMANEQITKTFEQKFEIVSLVGTLSQDGCHLHISLADVEGNVIGGHLKEGCSVYSTAEVILAEFDDLIFNRIDDPETGFKELNIIKNI
jgi:predicted DNA-binding protein with PD1-like motif